MTQVYKQPPYILAFISENQEFIYFGSEHSYDIGHPQFNLIKRYWDRWISDKEPGNCIALIEGGDIKDHPTLEQAVSLEGERGYLTWLAKNSGIDYLSPEPGYKDEMSNLLKSHTKEQILHYYFIRAVVQWHRLNPRPDFDTYFSFVKEMPKRYGLDDFELSIDKLKAIHRQITESDLNYEEEEFLKSLVNPYQSVAVTNNVSKRSMQFRDEYIVDQICEIWQEGKNIFAVYGHSHVAEQEAALRRKL